MKGILGSSSNLNVFLNLSKLAKVILYLGTEEVHYNRNTTNIAFSISLRTLNKDTLLPITPPPLIKMKPTFSVLQIPLKTEDTYWL